MLKKEIRKTELNKKKSERGLTLTEAVELSTLERTDLKQCEEHNRERLYDSKCPNCFDIY